MTYPLKSTNYTLKSKLEQLSLLASKKLSYANPPRPFELHLPTGFIEYFSLQPPPIAFFKLFFSRAIIESIHTNTNTYATSKESRISRYGLGYRWKPMSS